MSEIKIKVQLPNQELRRVALDRAELTIAAVRARVAPMVSAPVDSVALGFVDTENEVITITTDGELVDLIADCEKFSRIPRLVVSLKTAPPVTKDEAPSQTKQEQQQPADDRSATTEEDARTSSASTLDLLAQLLARPEVVAKLQRTASSPVLWDALSASASAYLEQGPMGGITAALSQAPAARAVFEELVEEVPELQELVSRVVESHFGSFDPLSAFVAAASSGGGAGGFPPHRPHHAPPFFRCGPPPPHPSHGQHPPPGCHPFARWGGGGPWGPRGGCSPAPPHPQSGPTCGVPPSPAQQPPREVHPNVVCDGCSSSFEMKRRSFLASNVTRAGNIAGPRYKSTSLDDYDLCETCHDSKRFLEMGPFVRVPGQQQPQPQPQPAPFQGNPWANNNNGCGNGGRPRGCRGGGGAFGRCGGIRNVIHEVMSQEAANMAAAIAASLREAKERAEAEEGGKKKEPESVVPAAKVVEPVASVVVSQPEEVRAEEEEDEEEWEEASGSSAPVPSTTVDPVEKWRVQLNRLADLGFTDIAQYIPIMEEEGGDLERVVNRIIRRNA